MSVRAALCELPLTLEIGESLIGFIPKVILNRVKRDCADPARIRRRLDRFSIDSRYPDLPRHPPEQLNRGPCETPRNLSSLRPAVDGLISTDNSNRPGAPRVPYLSDPETLFKFQRHSIKQSIYPGFAFAPTSRSPCDFDHVQIRRDLL
jgi:hypothetical protein